MAEEVLGWVTEEVLLGWVALERMELEVLKGRKRAREGQRERFAEGIFSIFSILWVLLAMLKMGTGMVAVLPE